MPGKYETSPTGNSVLKTTTWGSLIAFSAVMLLAGIRYNHGTPSSDLNGRSAQVEEHSQAAASHTAAPAQSDSTQTGTTLRALPRHSKSLPAQTVVSQVSASAAATAGEASGERVFIAGLMLAQSVVGRHPIEGREQLDEVPTAARANG